MHALDDPAVREFVRRSLVVEVATRSAKRRPFVTPLWFVVDRGELYITTGPATWAGRNIAQCPDVTLLFWGERLPGCDRILRLHGAGSCHRRLPSWRVLLRIAAKYYVSGGALPVELRNARKWRLRAMYYGQVSGGFGHLRVVPAAAEFLARP